MDIIETVVASWQVRPFTSTGTWAVVWFAQLLAPPAAATVIMTVSTTGTIKRWDLLLDSGGYNLQGFDAAGTQLYNAAALYDPIAKPPAWIAFDLLVTQSGGNVEEIRPKAMKIRKDHENQIEALLTDAQKKQWHQMLGKPLALDE